MITRRFFFFVGASAAAHNTLKGILRHQTFHDREHGFIQGDINDLSHPAVHFDVMYGH